MGWLRRKPKVHPDGWVQRVLPVAVAQHRGYNVEGPDDHLAVICSRGLDGAVAWISVLPPDAKLKNRLNPDVPVV